VELELLEVVKSRGPEPGVDRSVAVVKVVELGHGEAAHGAWVGGKDLGDDACLCFLVGGMLL
jgi:hypothetical protein